jgi:hypothetical protein
MPLRQGGKRIERRALDLQIAATAVQHNLSLVTRNREGLCGRPRAHAAHSFGSALSVTPLAVAFSGAPATGRGMIGLRQPIPVGPDEAIGGLLRSIRSPTSRATTSRIRRPAATLSNFGRFEAVSHSVTGR